MGDDFYPTGYDGELTRTNAVLYKVKDPMRSPSGRSNKDLE
jgi:hypothetical protein